MFTYVHMCMHWCVRACMCTCTCVLYARWCVCVHWCVPVCVRCCVHVYVHTGMYALCHVCGCTVVCTHMHTVHMHVSMQWCVCAHRRVCVCAVCCLVCARWVGPGSPRARAHSHTASGARFWTEVTVTPSRFPSRTSPLLLLLDENRCTLKNKFC